MSKINLGICGSGQLSMMLCQAAKKLGVYTIVLTNDENGPAKKYCDEYFYCDLKEIKNLKSFANKIDVSTLEFENFDYHLLKEIEKIKPFYPKPEINKIVQNRILEKNFFKSLEIPITEYAVIKKRADIKENGHLLPGILKSAIGGYDGHLSYQINSSKDLDTISLDPTTVNLFGLLSSCLSVTTSVVPSVCVIVISSGTCCVRFDTLPTFFFESCKYTLSPLMNIWGRPPDWSTT